MTAGSARDVVFTPFMLRVRALLDGEGPAPPALPVRTSELRRRPATVDAWFVLRARAEQLVAEANAMLKGRRALIDLDDEAGTGELAFCMRHEGRWARLRVDGAGRTAFVEIVRWTGPSAAPVELVDGADLEDLLVQLIAPTAEGRTS